MIDAVAYFGDLDDGISRPKKMLCSDGIMRVVKFNYPVVCNRALFHEFLGDKIARLLGIPVFEQSLVNVPDELAVAYSTVEGMSSGIKIGSPFTILDKNIADSGLFREPLPKLYGSCRNLCDIPSIFAYDVWTHNNDRGSNVGNLLVVPNKDGSKDLIVHDHGFILFGPTASMDRYKGLTEFRDAALDWQRHKFPFAPIYEALKLQIDLSDPQRNNPFIPVVKRIESIKREELESIMSEVPSEWQIPDYEKNAVVNFLYERRHKVRDLFNHLVSIWWFPMWNGGALGWPDLHASSE